MRAWLLGFLAAGLGWAQPLQVDDVLASVRRSYPPLLVALQEGAVADAEVLAAQGRFDLTLRARVDSDSFGYYENQRFDAVVEQAFAYQGMSLFGGYRLGDGSFAVYDGKLQTRDSGEWRSGLRIPLLRDRAIDPRRAELRKAELGRAVARLSIEQQRLVIGLAAVRRYWDWVAAGQRAAVAKSLLDIALQRDDYLKEQVRAGALPAIEVADNARAILQRRSQLVEAERALQAAAIELSLFYRDEKGQPQLPERRQLPDRFPQGQSLDTSTLQEQIETAQRRRPELARLETQLGQNEIDTALARNQRLPGVDIVTGFAQDLGRIPSPLVNKIPRNELRSSLVFELPWQRRTATGKLQAAEAKNRQLAERARFQKDQIAAEVRDALSAVQTASERARLLREEVEVTRQVEDAERTRFELGDGTLFQLNLREQATADAAWREIGALADLQRAMVVYESSTGALLDRL